MYLNSPWAGCGTRSICKWSTAGFKSELSFFRTGCLTKSNDPSLLYYLPMVGGECIYIYIYMKSEKEKWERQTERRERERERERERGGVWYHL